MVYVSVFKLGLQVHVKVSIVILWTEALVTSVCPISVVWYVLASLQCKSGIQSGFILSVVFLPKPE